MEGVHRENYQRFPEQKTKKKTNRGHAVTATSDALASLSGMCFRIASRKDGN